MRLRGDLRKKRGAGNFQACRFNLFVVLLRVSTELRPRRPGPLRRRPPLNSRPYDPSFAERTVELARDGLFRYEIAEAIGVSVEDFEAWSSQEPLFAAALADADTAAGAWWDRQAREAMANNKPFRATLWARVMAQHYGRQGHLPRKPADKPAGKPVVRAQYDIPDNGMERPEPRRRRH